MVSTAKNALIEAIVAFIGDRDLLDRDEVRSALDHEIDRDGPESLLTLMRHLSGRPPRL